MKKEGGLDWFFNYAIVKTPDECMDTFKSHDWRKNELVSAYEPIALT
ncbi:MAG: hypothetical protein HUJ51_05060 [Eggerthellaceae bacterium]|nr:hypothetical protein [Eggerthellaceae bacterium]